MAYDTLSLRPLYTFVSLAIVQSDGYLKNITYCLILQLTICVSFVYAFFVAIIFSSFTSIGLVWCALFITIIDSTIFGFCIQQSISSLWHYIF